MTPPLSVRDYLQSASELPEDPEERRDRYEHLKISVAAMRTKCRSTPPPSPACHHSSNSLVPYAAYFSSPSPGPGTSDSHIRQIEASGLLESYAMQALRLDCEMKLKDSQEEMEKLRGRLRDKIRRTEQFDRELQKQREKLEAKVAFFSDQSKVLEEQVAEQAIRHGQDLHKQAETIKCSMNSDGEKREEDITRLVSSYEDSINLLKNTSEAQSAEIEKLERECSFRLEQMERSKVKADDSMKYLDGQMKMVAEEAEKFRTKYDEQEKEWNVKLQHMTAMHQFQIKTLCQENELQIEEKIKERELHSLTLQTYKSQKLKDMEYVEERVKGVLDAKEATIVQLKLELRLLHQQLKESANMLDDD